MHLEEDLHKRKIQCNDLQCVYTDTKLSHRFIRFELLDEFQEKGKEMVDEYISIVFILSYRNSLLGRNWDPPAQSPKRRRH
jgi:hypothetical protein